MSYDLDLQLMRCKIRAEVAEGRLSAIGLVIDDLHATSAISQDVADQLTDALDGGEQK